MALGSNRVSSLVANGGDSHTVLQQAFSTVGLSAGDWLRCAAVASSVLWLREVSKLITRASAMKVIYDK